MKQTYYNTDIVTHCTWAYHFKHKQHSRIFFWLQNVWERFYIVSDWRSPKSLSQTHYARFYYCPCQFVNFIVCLFVRSAKNTSATFSISLEDIYVVEQTSDKTWTQSASCRSSKSRVLQRRKVAQAKRTKIGGNIKAKHSWQELQRKTLQQAWFAPGTYWWCCEVVIVGTSF